MMALSAPLVGLASEITVATRGSLLAARTSFQHIDLLVRRRFRDGMTELFGSCATELMTEASDVDLCVTVPSLMRAADTAFQALKAARDQLVAATTPPPHLN